MMPFMFTSLTVGERPLEIMEYVHYTNTHALESPEIQNVFSKSDKVPVGLAHPSVQMRMQAIAGILNELEWQPPVMEVWTPPHADAYASPQATTGMPVGAGGTLAPHLSNLDDYNVSQLSSRDRRRRMRAKSGCIRGYSN